MPSTSTFLIHTNNILEDDKMKLNMKLMEIAPHGCYMCNGHICGSIYNTSINELYKVMEELKVPKEDFCVEA